MNIRVYFALHTTNYKCEQHVHRGKQLSYRKISPQRIKKHVDRTNDFIVETKLDGGSNKVRKMDGTLLHATV